MRTVRRLLPYLQRHRAAYLVGFLALLGANFFTTLGPRYIERAIDLISNNHPANELRRTLLTLLAVALASGVFRFGMRRQLNGASREVETNLRDDLFAHLISLPASFFQGHGVGDLMARATNDLLALRMVAGPAVMYLIDTIVRTAMILPAMLLISPSLTWWSLLPSLGLPITMVVLGGVMHRRALAVQDAFGDLTSFVQEHLGGLRIVRAYAQGDAERQVFDTFDRDYLDRNIALAKSQGLFHPLLGLLGGIGGIIALVVGGREVLAGRMSLGGLVAFTVYLATLVWPMIALGWAVSLMQRGEAAAQRIDALFEVRPSIADPVAPQRPAVSHGARAVVFEDVWFRYPAADASEWTLQGISFTIAAGEALGVVGATGSGKSTIGELLTRTWDVDRGRITIDGIDIRELKLADLRASIGMVPQETFLFSDTLRGNVLLDRQDDAGLMQAAAIARLDAALPDLPHGWDTMLGERGINLSGGQRQRAAIARALVRDPGILILDDALSAVDARTEADILLALREAADQRTALIISHRSSAVRDAQEIIVLEAGKIVERGTHEALTRQGERYVQLLAQEALERSLAES